MLAYKTVSGTKSFRKIVHLTMQSMAFCLSTIGVWAAYKFHSEKGVDHFYTLHSWLGLTCLFLFGTQVCALSLSLPSLPSLFLNSFMGHAGPVIYSSTTICAYIQCLFFVLLVEC
jgi:predicted ferric reductase